MLNTRVPHEIPCTWYVDSDLTGISLYHVEDDAVDHIMYMDCNTTITVVSRKSAHENEQTLASVVVLIVGFKKGFVGGRCAAWDGLLKLCYGASSYKCSTCCQRRN